MKRSALGQTGTGGAARRAPGGGGVFAFGCGVVVGLACCACFNCLVEVGVGEGVGAGEGVGGEKSRGISGGDDEVLPLPEIWGGGESERFAARRGVVAAGLSGTGWGSRGPKSRAKKPLGGGGCCVGVTGGDGVASTRLGLGETELALTLALALAWDRVIGVFKESMALDRSRW